MIKSSIMEFADVDFFQEFSLVSDRRKRILVKIPLIKCLSRGVKYKTSSSGVKYETEYITSVRYNAYDVSSRMYVFIDDSIEVIVSFVKGRD